MAEGMLAANASMAGLAGASPVRRIEHTVPGTGIQADDDPAFEELLQIQQPGIHTLLDELRDRLPDTEVLWAHGYPIAGSDESGHAEAIQTAEQADIILLTLGGKHGTSSIASMGEGIDATDINPPPVPGDPHLQALAARQANGGRPHGRPARVQRRCGPAPERPGSKPGTPPNTARRRLSTRCSAR